MLSVDVKQDFVLKCMTEKTNYIRTPYGKPWNMKKVIRLLSYDDADVRVIMHDDNPAGIIWKHQDSVAYYPGSNIKSGSYFITRMILPEYRGIGLGTNALTEYANIFPKLYSSVNRNNIASIKSLEKAGWIKIKTDRTDIFIYASCPV